MIEFGSTLRRAREAKGLSTNDLAQQTHLMVQQIEALEREDFSKIAAPIYGRGFVKLYCEAVGLEVQPMVAEFMELFSGNREQPIRMREPTQPKSVEPVHQPMPDEEPPSKPLPIDNLPPLVEASSFVEKPASAATEPPPQTEADFSLESEVVKTPPPQPQPSELFATRPTVTENRIDEMPAPKPQPRGPSRYAPPPPIDDEADGDSLSLPHIPRAVWRLLALGAVALIVLWLLFAGLRALYRATMDGDPETAATTTTEQAAAAPVAPPTTAPVAQPVTPPKSDRSLKTIPPLYID